MKNACSYKTCCFFIYFIEFRICGTSAALQVGCYSSDRPIQQGRHVFYSFIFTFCCILILVDCTMLLHLNYVPHDSDLMPTL